MSTQQALITKAKDVLDIRTMAPRHLVGIGFAILVLAIPLAYGTISQLTFIAALYFAIFAMSWDTVSGYTGQFSFGHSFLFAVGGYTSGLLNLGHGVDPLFAIIIAIFVTMAAGFVFGAPALRLSGPYFAVVTFLLPLVLLQIFVLQRDIFGGELGLARPDLLVSSEVGFRTTILHNYYLAAIAFLFVLVLLYAVTRSNAGRVFTAIREDEITVASCGINPTKFKLFAFVLSAAVAGFGGALYVHSPVGQPQPSQLLAVAVSINVLLASLLGGAGTITGPAVGGLLYFLLNDWLREVGVVLPVLNVEVSQFSLVIFSIIVLLLVFFLPSGILPWLTRRSRQVLARVRGTPAAADGGRAPLETIYDNHEQELPGGDDDE
jgi:branched-chain amino acid transport system permease protein